MCVKPFFSSTHFCFLRSIRFREYRTLHASAILHSNFNYSVQSFLNSVDRDVNIVERTEKNGFVTATKFGTTNKFFVVATKNFAAATKRFVGRTKHFVVVTKYFCCPYFNK